ncbi:tyrosine-type recombinase/integrase [Sporomusa sphaeroides]|uniref:tyrosine-type recombinase/integrase n=1 Tax=Sporomusa sphaeroides TaxID=47679 RepID=UPI002C9E3B06|nr:site-specific integrase [Sporomusa sphaeroides]HML33798.1 site-specific integrase [Sporomusa sphaeroides]
MPKRPNNNKDKAKPKRKNNQGSIYYDKATNKYRAAITTEDGKRASKRFDSEQEAEDWVALKRAEMGLGTFIAPSETRLGEYMVEWLETHIEPDVRQRTLDRYISLTAHLGKLKDKPIQQITATMLKKLYNNIKVKRVHKDPKTKEKIIEMVPASGETKKKVHNLIHACLEQARIDRIIQSNPAKDVTPPKVTREEVETFTEEEINKMLTTCKSMKNLSGHPEHQWYPAVYMAVVTGVRMSELLGLRWIDAQDGYIYIRQGLHMTDSGEIIFEDPKSSAGKRKISLPPEYIPILAQCKAKAMEKYGEDFSTELLVFTSLEGTPINPQNWQRFWRKLLHQAGVEPKNFHALRHTHATKLLAAGMPLMDVSRRLGHAKPSHTLDLYGHAMPGHDDIIASKIADIYNLPDKIEKPPAEPEEKTPDK